MYNSIWYTNLIKPRFSPPNWLFAPVWSILYILIFSSLILYIYSSGKNKDLGYLLFAIQILLNFMWTPIFFGLKSIAGGFIVVILLDIFVFLTIWEFSKFSKLAGFFLIPYFIWILFATYLNISYLILN